MQDKVGKSIVRIQHGYIICLVTIIRTTGLLILSSTTIKSRYVDNQKDRYRFEEGTDSVVSRLSVLPQVPLLRGAKVVPLHSAWRGQR